MVSGERLGSGLRQQPKHYELRVWQESMRLVKSIYTLTETFPDRERFGLTQQMRRAAVSIPSNIAEGAARGRRKEFVHFLCVARGSLAELDTQWWIARDLGFASSQPQELTEHMQALMAQLNALISSLRKTTE